ncbi:hypothetical protein N8I77_013676 [Diaporthe amygdali]|uniref:Aminoglycoside phosphotransferase domain-containing protein n=1 Tax=Phomopsis amygdali TaxID=1214568 RepID=A0AAD9S3F1_PHOAM|nr:hypothetical protein N8I77_013676 [Diaporthe amygdali]
MHSEVIIKEGTSVWPNEEAALNLIHSTLPPNTVPVPHVFLGTYNRGMDGVVTKGTIWMEHMPGKTLREAWPSLDQVPRERVCRDTWAIVEKLREIPRPETDDGAFYLAADGTSKIIQTLLGDEHDTYPPMKNDEDLRARIWERYVKNNGLSYPEGNGVYEMLPRSEVSVFTHGDIHPRNILLEQNVEEGSGVRITGLIDFESAGFYPDYWEFSEMMACGRKDAEWMEMMDRTKPREWDISGVRKVRRVLF